jgi:hypothetical protein
MNVELDASIDIGMIEQGIYSGIGDKEINSLNLRKLNASYNSKITNLNHMAKSLI